MKLFELFARLAFRNATAGRRTLPGLYVLGAPKCGTTALYEIIRNHPNFLPAILEIKELSFLQDIENFQAFYFKGTKKVLFKLLYGSYHGPRSYRKFFPLKREMEQVRKRTGYDAVTGDFSPVTLYCPRAAERIRQISPDAKLIIMLRDPVKRAYSEYNMLAARYQKEWRTFEQVIEDELNGSGVGHFIKDTYLRKGVYEPYVRQYMEIFPRSQMLILRSEDFFSRTGDEFARVLEFLNLPAEGKSLAGKEFYKNETSLRIPMKSETRQFLYDYYRPHNKRLFELIGQDMDWKEGAL